VLAELERATDPRFKEIMTAAVQHLHGFVRDARLTDAEFHQACAFIAKLGQLTTPSHNEVVLISGSLGISALVCLLNNGQNGQTETTANLMGPFWRMASPRVDNGGSIVRSATPGAPIFVNAWVRDVQGRPVAGADVGVGGDKSAAGHEIFDALADIGADLFRCVRFIECALRIHAAAPETNILPEFTLEFGKFVLWQIRNLLNLLLALPMLFLKYANRLNISIK
jgi:hypothetical protein